MKKSNDYTWVTYIKNRIKDNKNFIAPFIGKTGSGKSWSALSVAQMLDKNFSINQIVFRGIDLMKIINDDTKKKKGMVIVWDEAGIDLSNRTWQSAINKLMNMLLQTFRHQNIILLFTVPYLSFIDAQTRKLLHAEFETTKIDKSTKQVAIKPKAIQYNSGNDKLYRKYLVVDKKGRRIKVKRWHVDKPSDDLIEQYEKAKGTYTKALNTTIENELKKQYADPQELIWLKLTPLQREIVKCVKEKGITNVTDIAEELGVKQQHISQAIPYIQKKGLLLNEITRKNGILNENNTEIPVLI